MTVQWSTDPLSDYPRCGDGGHSRSNHLNEPVLQKQVGLIRQELTSAQERD